MHEDYIPLEDCVDGGLYRVKARNFSIAIYEADRKVFHGRRRKFDEVYVWPETHWDASETFGTAKPIELLEMVDIPPHESRSVYLARKEKEYRRD